MANDDDQVFSSAQVLDEYDSDCTFVPVAKKRQVSEDDQTAIGDVIPLHKHWSRRHSYFSLYDHGVLLDRTGWFSVTPEAVAKHTASLIPSPAAILYDGFVGIGGNAIQFAFSCFLVVGTDTDEERLRLCAHNCRVYGVQNVELVRGDFAAGCKWMRADVVFASPPWGGPSCNVAPVYRLDTMPVMTGRAVYELAKGVSDNVIFYLPRHTSITDLAELDPDGRFRVVLHRENRRRVVAISVLFGRMFIEDAIC